MLWDEGNAYRIELQNAQKTNVYAPVDIDGYVRPIPEQQAWFEFRKGDRVRISGLESKAEWNDKIATVRDHFNRDKLRWPIEIKDKDGNVEAALLKADNLKSVYKKE